MKFCVIRETVFELLGEEKRESKVKGLKLSWKYIDTDKTNSVHSYLKIWSQRVGFYLSVERLLNMELTDKKSFGSIDLALSNGLYKYL